MAGVTLDSEAAFQERCVKIGMSEATQGVLFAKGYNTYGHLAFAISASPTALDDAAVRTWITEVFDGTLPSTHQISCINRLLFEAQARSISDMKSRVEPQMRQSGKFLSPSA